MEELLGNIYSLAERFYGEMLSEYLWGYNCSTQGYDAELIYTQFGVGAIITAGVLSAIYYYLWNPVVRQMFYWWLMLGITAFTNWVIAFSYLMSDLDNGLIGSCLLYDTNGYQQIDVSNIISFGIVNAAFSALLFFIISIIIKWRSKTVKYYPF